MIAKAPLIVVPMRENQQSSSTVTTRFVGVYESYLQKLFQYQAVPLLVPLNTPLVLLEQMCALGDGLMLTGGEDIDPRHYGETRHDKTANISAKRDELELKLCEIFVTQRKPVLGICRGCQVIAVADGGKLNQHIADTVSEEIHILEDGDRKKPMPRHTVSVSPTSELAKIIGANSITVNSWHHQSIRELGKNFKVVGKSSSGVIEAIEHIDSSYFCFGVQGHPEAEENGELETLFKSFVEACKKSN